MQEADVMTLFADIKTLAQRYYASTGRPLGVTGEVAEYEAARLLGLELAPVRQSGWDASEADSSRTYQIKGRVLRDRSRLGQRMGALSATKEWDAVLLVLLDESYEATEIWEADRGAVLEVLARPGSRARSERGQLAITQFISVGSLRWGRSDVPQPRGRDLQAPYQIVDGAVRYRFSRLCFRADVIEPLGDDDPFEVDTPQGLFRFTKRQFCSEFANVRQTKSYAESGLYHYSRTPARAMRFLRAASKD